jgi:biopolymer transport protein ExbD
MAAIAREAATLNLSAAKSKPMMEMNTTPLIDVLLVLLIMFIITIPPISHNVSVELPAGGKSIEPNQLTNKIIVKDNNSIEWNGIPVTLDQLTLLLLQTKVMKPEPELQFQPAPYASYDTVDRTLAKIKGSGVTGFGFIGNEQYRIFGKAGRAPLQ